MKQVKYLLRGKRFNTWIDTGGLRETEKVIELHPSSVLNCFSGAFSSGFPLASHFDFPVSQSMFGTPQDPPTCVCESL